MSGTASPRLESVSVIIPVLNEALRLRDHLAALAGVPHIHEVIVVDGGSSDGTAALARSIGGARVIEAARGRAAQMNAGARLATGAVLLFLHADVWLPHDAVDQVRAALAEPGVVAGAFRTWTVSDRGHTWLSPLLHLADLRSRYSGLPYGDQAIFVRADVFRQVQGYPDQLLMEDLELSRRLRAVGAIRTVRANVRVSGRRFLQRPLYYAVLDNVLPVLYRLGVSAERLAELYGNPR